MLILIPNKFTKPLGQNIESKTANSSHVAISIIHLRPLKDRSRADIKYYKYSGCSAILLIFRINFVYILINNGKCQMHLRSMV